MAPDQAAKLADKGNKELAEIVKEHADKFEVGVGMLAMNNIPASLHILDKVKADPNLMGAQIFTRHLGKSIADPEFDPIFKKTAKLNLPLWLHPVFDQRKPDNNLVFSWEYELSQAMLQLVQSNIFKKYPHLKILVHHAGAMVPSSAVELIIFLMPNMLQCLRSFMLILQYWVIPLPCSLQSTIMTLITSFLALMRHLR